jgi:hypothetical protein
MMGEAKKRGTFEQRREEGVKKKSKRDAERSAKLSLLRKRAGKSALLPLVIALLATKNGDAA